MCKPILVFRFGPNPAMALGLALDQAEQKMYSSIIGVPLVIAVSAGDMLGIEPRQVYDAKLKFPN